MVWHHFLSAFDDRLVLERASDPLWISDTPLDLLWNGAFAVGIFFVLSGFVVSASANKRETGLPATLLFRYLRLALPVTISIIFAWALLSLMPNFAHELDVAHPSSWLRETYQGWIPGFGQALLGGLVRTFQTGRSLFNNAVWTMKIELIGSCGLYLIYRVKTVNIRVAILIAVSFLAPVLHQARYDGFTFGALLFEAFAAGRLPNRLPNALFATGIFIGAFGIGFPNRVGLPRLPGALTIGEPGGLIYPVAATLVVYGCIQSATISKALSHVAAQFLGRVSFPLYLVHVPLIYTVFCWLRLSIPEDLHPVLALGAVFFPTCLVVAYFGAVLVDEKILEWIRLSRRSVKRLPAELTKV